MLRGDGHTCIGSHVHRSTRVRRTVDKTRPTFFFNFTINLSFHLYSTTHRHCSPAVPLPFPCRSPPPNPSSLVRPWCPSSFVTSSGLPSLCHPKTSFPLPLRNVGVVIHSN
ncbi:unnamed protein product [Chondrus crispus]|uniref:Uncharacterized protein n=1 Tax=Chondrus crispus TaxID=2769 RepID=R7QGM5_CHOCR|nr:unnamed protein product [Chondrus crispus]CDF36611.1 unnamed protein product [Chondrus crispus]|eukprot:XP_005716430.1 unnamed protein product [Chondrus crispus]